ncbi:DUF11 domain-containing protein [Pimelobacter simplex]|uniref:DUF11 domain-containing protein n=1 Tax=Nocardioides simplex TaxID=2045 RepID=UPI00193242AE|nr:DUF11 domain-containing protein [Pimelobacter simplex]
MRLAGIAALATATATISMLGAAAPAHSDPAEPPTEPQVLALGAYDVSAAPGTCAAIVTLEGGNGGTAISGADNDDEPPTDDPTQVGGGQGARLQFRIPVSPTDVLTGVVGRGGAGGGAGGASGTDQGGNGGAGTHPGAGGGGYTSLLLNGDLIALVGGGGGSGGGHNPNAGGGGHAGVIEGPGAFAGQDGASGVDASATPRAPRGGGAGAADAPGLGGVHADKPADNGMPGDARNGGDGGGGDGADQGGGGGAGYFGGGGGATTVGDVSGGTSDPTDPDVGTAIVGGGGGGGSSFFSTAHGAVFVPQAEGDSLAPDGASRNGTGEIEWVPCNYDLGITKTAAAEVFEPGTAVSYTLKVTNNGPDLMGIDDTVTITDDKAAGGTLVSVVASGGGTPFTCDTAVGSKIPAGGKIDCSRPVGDDVRGLDVGETLTVVYSQVLTGSAPVLNNVSITDRGNPANNTAAATVKPAAPGISLVKKATPKKVAHLGQKIKYTFTVTNTGNIALASISIAEQQFSGKGSLTPTCPALPATGLAPGGSVTCTATYKVRKKDLAAGKVVNVATAAGTTPAGNPVQSLPSKAKVKTPKPKLAGTPATGARVQSGR